jgi:hypothetical protein
MQEEINDYEEFFWREPFRTVVLQFLDKNEYNPDLILI